MTTTDQQVSDIQASVAPFAPGLGTATTIGSLPHTDRSAACRAMVERFAELPCAPALPRLEPREHMLAQAAWGVPGVAVDEAGELSVTPDALDPDAPLETEPLAGPPFATLHHFVELVAERRGPLKVPVTGPYTLGRALITGGAAPPIAFAVAAAAVQQRVEAVLDLVTGATTAAPVMVTLDEPGLVGAFGAGGPLDPDDVIDLISGTMAVIERRGVSGLHCCGPTDWKAALAAGPTVAFLPVDVDLAPWSWALAAHLERGGFVGWGTVPTRAPLGESGLRLWKVLSGVWCDLVRAGCDPHQLRHQALITPVCGLADHDRPSAEAVLDITRELANRLHDQVVGVKLSVGA